MARLEEIAERCEKATNEPWTDGDNWTCRCGAWNDRRTSCRRCGSWRHDADTLFRHDVGYLLHRLKAAERFIAADSAAVDAESPEYSDDALKLSNERDAALKAWLAAKGEAR